MSRSYKKHPVLKDNKKTVKLLKREAGKKVRRHKETIPNGRAYRKIYNSIDIHDCIVYNSYKRVQKYLNFTQSLIREGYYSEDTLGFKHYQNLEENCSYPVWKKTWLGK